MTAAITLLLHIVRQTSWLSTKPMGVLRFVVALKDELLACRAGLSAAQLPAYASVLVLVGARK